MILLVKTCYIFLNRQSDKSKNILCLRSKTKFYKYILWDIHATDPNLRPWTLIYYIFLKNVPWFNCLFTTIPQLCHTNINPLSLFNYYFSRNYSHLFLPTTYFPKIIFSLLLCLVMVIPRYQTNNWQENFEN